MRRLASAAAAVACVALAGSAGAATGTHFYVPPPNGDAQHQIATLISSGDAVGAARLSALADTSHAVWVTGGTPNDARVLALKTANRAAGKGELPVFALYNIPGRDCSNYSAGGATDRASYEAWIDGVAAGLRGTSMIILEPDSLGLLPQTNCGSAVFTDADRYAELRYAVTTLTAAGGSVYLDGTHSGWQGVGQAAQRLLAAGVANAAGFYLNVSNYQYTPNEVFYGTWISECIALGGSGCPDQWWNGGPATGWDGVGLDPYTVWSNRPYDHQTLASNTVGIDSRYAMLLGGLEPATHFVIDTSRNGRGPWAGTDDWCNPPQRGAGIQPTTETGSSLVDAYLWIKVPGESDGQCRGGPAAGVWFPQQALELAMLASPALP